MTVLVAIELVLRGLGYAQTPPRYYDRDLDAPAFYPDRTHTMMEKGQSVGEAHINRAGFRGPWYEGPKQEGVLRVAVLGDSFTFGWSVAEEEAYPRQVSRLLEAAGIRHELINFGVPGYNTAQELALYERDVRPFDPDIVIVGLISNDLEPTPTPPEFAFGSVGRWLSRTGYCGAWEAISGSKNSLLRPTHSRAKQELQRTWKLHQKEIIGDPEGERGRPYLEAWRPAFEDLLKTVTDDGRRLLVLIFPTRLQRREVRNLMQADPDQLQIPDSVTGYQRCAIACCEAADVPYIDLLMPFVECKQPWGDIDKAHPSPQGHQLTAFITARKLTLLGWITPEKLR